jgi:hypothetical protein
MGYRDHKLILSNSQSVTGDVDSTYYLDTELTNPRWEKGLPPAVVVTVETAPGGTTGVNLIVVHKASEPTVNDANLVTVRALNAELVAGAQIVIPIPQGITLLRYVRLYYDLINGDETSGVFTAYFSPLPLYDK